MENCSPVRRKSIIKADSPRSLTEFRSSSAISRCSPYEKMHSLSLKGGTFIQCPRPSGREVTNMPVSLEASAMKPLRRTRVPEGATKNVANGLRSENSFCSKSCTSAREIRLISGFLLFSALRISSRIPFAPLRVEWRTDLAAGGHMFAWGKRMYRAAQPNSDTYGI